jgi:hypothetical protein
MKKVVT